MTKNTKKNDTALIGCGYWGTNIAKVLTKIKRNKIIIYDENRSNSIILNKRFPDKTTISKSLKDITIYANSHYVTPKPSLDLAIKKFFISLKY